MKKSAIAVAVAAVLAAPVALADVSISGQLQTQIVSFGGDDGVGVPDGLYVSDGGMFSDTGAGNANGGNFGAINVVASEDLGDGMKALAKYAFNVNTGSGIGTREAYVGLAGNFGAVLGGRLNHPYKTSTVSWDPFLSTFMQARNNAGMAAGLYGSEVDNALAYAGTFGAAKVVAAYVVDEVKDATDANEVYGNGAVALSVNAPVGPVEVAVAYLDMTNMGACTTYGLAAASGSVTCTATAEGADKATAMKLGVKWVSGDITVAGQYETMDEGFGDYAQLYLTGSYKMGNNTVSASFGQADYEASGADNSTYMAIGLNHAMSKNTSAFVGYRSTSWADDTDESAVGAGLRVKF